MSIHDRQPDVQECDVWSEVSGDSQCDRRVMPQEKLSRTRCNGTERNRLGLPGSAFLTPPRRLRI
jgi:hypothetical protein